MNIRKTISLKQSQSYAHPHAYVVYFTRYPASGRALRSSGKEEKVPSFAKLAINRSPQKSAQSSVIGFTMDKHSPAWSAKPTLEIAGKSLPDR